MVVGVGLKTQMELTWRVLALHHALSHLKALSVVEHVTVKSEYLFIHDVFEVEAVVQSDVAVASYRVDLVPGVLEWCSFLHCLPKNHIRRYYHPVYGLCGSFLGLIFLTFCIGGCFFGPVDGPDGDLVGFELLDLGHKYLFKCSGGGGLDEVFIEVDKPLNEGLGCIHQIVRQVRNDRVQYSGRLLAEQFGVFCEVGALPAVRELSQKDTRHTLDRLLRS